jgi:predicted site-specific integrase-resolvase
VNYLSLGQAAKETGKSKATISKYIKNGKLSVVSKEDGSYQIEPSELFRVFPIREQETGINEQSQTLMQTGVNRVLEKEIEFLHQRLNDKNDVISDLRERLDKESEERRKLTMLLSDMREKTPQTLPERQKGFWAALIGKNH